MPMTAGDILTIPDTLQVWPWPRAINPWYAVCKEESAAWCEAFKVFGPKAQQSFNRGNFGLLGALAYPLLNRDGCRIGCDFMHLVFVIDEHTDVSEPAVARQQADLVMDAMRNPHQPRPPGEWIGAEVARSFWENAIRTATPTAQRRFVDAFQQYMDAVVQQADDRSSSRIRNVDSYFEVRRDTIGAKPAFAVSEIHLNIPDEIIAHPIVAKLTYLTIDAIIISNDLCSYNIEQARGDDGHNLVTVVMHQYNLDVQQAMNWIGDLHDQIASDFLQAFQELPTFGGPPALDRELRTYVDGLGNGVRANDTWNYETERYFGKKGIETQRTRKTVLLPKRRALASEM
ncbi:terpenoid synthase [Mycena amicta]|nr:terpenoid synthase [Mycena amicta]